MLKKTLIPLVIVLFSAGNAFSSVLITDFGNTGPNSFAETFTTFSTSQSDSSITLSGQEGDLIFGNVTPISIAGSFESVSLTGTYSGAYSGVFTIDLFDTGDASRTYQGFFSDFTPNVLSTVTLAFAQADGTFNGTVGVVGLTAGGTGSSSVNFVATQLVAIPEPRAWVMIIGALLLMTIFRKRSKAFA